MSTKQVRADAVKKGDRRNGFQAADTHCFPSGYVAIEWDGGHGWMRGFYHDDEMVEIEVPEPSISELQAENLQLRAALDAIEDGGEQLANSPSFAHWISKWRVIEIRKKHGVSRV